jgi:hypothetical protein
MAEPMLKDEPAEWRFIPLLQSGTMRWLLVAAATWVAGLASVSEVAPAQAERWVELGLQIAQGVAIAWAGYHRYSNPTPPLAASRKLADEKNAAIAAEGDLK